MNTSTRARLMDFIIDHILNELCSIGIADDCGLVFKGGTALRKTVLGLTSRLSEDLDF